MGQAYNGFMQNNGGENNAFLNVLFLDYAIVLAIAPLFANILTIYKLPG